MTKTQANSQYESAKAAFRAAEDRWDREIRSTYGKPWYQLDFVEDTMGEPGTVLNETYIAFKAALDHWQSVCNGNWWRESRNVA